MTRSESPRARILFVDDEPSARSGIERLLSGEGYGVRTAENGREALELAAELPPDVIVTDLRMPEMDGLELIEALRAAGLGVPVIVVTAFGDVTTAVSAMRAGAEDYLSKPLDIDALLVAIERAIEHRNLRAETENLRRQLSTQLGEGMEGLLGASGAMQEVYRTVQQVAGSRATVLVTGESGTGKGEVARAIHARGSRSDKPLVTLQCAALAESLLESELFGHEKGSFTGADKRRMGRWEQAHGGTLFLDEVGEISLPLQVKLLRVLQERSFERVGGNETIKVDVRLVAATNKDLAAEVKAGRFREDLYYRLNVIHIAMPPLRARGSDVLVLANHFLRRFADENHKPLRRFSDAARARLLAHRWPGNVRELENAIERGVVMARGEELDVTDLPGELGAPVVGGDEPRIPGSSMAEIERYAILKTLEAEDGSTSRAAQVLGISVRTIQYRLSEYGLGRGGEPRRKQPD